VSAGTDVGIFDARADAVGATASFVASFCAHHGIDANDTLRLTLVVEELFLNIVMHGYREAPGTSVQLALSIDAGHVRLVCEDRAPAYDPREALAHAPDDLDAPLEERGIGGLGQWLVGNLVEVERYEREGDVNRVTLRMPRSRK
jgi:serine/threonine-protein kinase RsbW/sigma-B regulation protein RsbU (phosphoserine phosphatase)